HGAFIPSAAANIWLVSSISFLHLIINGGILLAYPLIWQKNHLLSIGFDLKKEDMS
ncbi:MAG: hypothetical protein QG673_1395, partial [Pseudomonadota bacterium]|nr:hypothetical protein [Pseudomonadota bacterium]